MTCRGAKRKHPSPTGTVTNGRSAGASPVDKQAKLSTNPMVAIRKMSLEIAWDDARFRAFGDKVGSMPFMSAVLFKDCGLLSFPHLMESCLEPGRQWIRNFEKSDITARCLQQSRVAAKSLRLLYLEKYNATMYLVEVERAYLCKLVMFDANTTAKGLEPTINFSRQIQLLSTGSSSGDAQKAMGASQGE